jgi:hypothetical protein
MKSRLLLGLLAIVLSGCAPGSEPEASFASRDSSGIRIVEYGDAPAGSRTLELSAQPLFRVGDGPGEREIEFVGQGALLADGGAVIVDGRTNQEVLRLAPDGAVAAVLARSGQGPGEVRYVASLVAVGNDTVLVHDPFNRKILFFAGDSVVRSAAAEAGPRTFMGAVGFERPATLLMVTTGYQPKRQEGWLQGYFMRYDLDASRMDTVASFDMAPGDFDPRNPQPTSPFRNGGVVGGSGHLFVSGRADLPQLTWRGPDGEVVQILRWVPRLTYPTQADFDAFMASMKPMMKRMNPRMSDADVDRIVERQNGLFKLDTEMPYPLFGLLQGDGQGGVWVSDYAAIDRDLGVRGWSVIAPDGEWRGHVTLPEHFRLLDVRGDRVLGVLLDEMDVQSVAVYELKETPAAP